ncbi:hypothetical protein D2V04_06220 [Pelagerythrobacter aerophilus]|uniref:Terminase large subunit gp17-like C-terminal domain-containing protein n=2 Tax=Pelagerythrobacter aerophilus TaxID=2306995 RepID=A0A418NKG3_9SPHN|nr:hypothetical protein D2V04_06220 [Pelagerythrobacter aerophilus]
MKLIPSTVTAARSIRTRRLRVVTNKGETIVSACHKFVGYRDDRRTRNFRSLSWVRADDLRPGDSVRFACPVWDEGTTKADGWLAGILDGEGWASAGNVGVAQNPGPVLDQIRTEFDRLGVGYKEHLAKEGCAKVQPDSIWSALRLLGTTRPVRLLPKARSVWEGRRGFVARGCRSGHGTGTRANPEGRHVAQVTRVDDLGEGEVVSLSTSSKTLIADGFLGHNCTLYFNESSQIPWGSIETAMSRLAQKCALAPAIATATGRTHLALKAYFDCNPPSKLHWSYQLFRAKLKPGTKESLPDPDNYVEMKINPDDNRENLPEEYFEVLDGMSSAKRTRFRDGEWASEVNGALWSLEDRKAEDGRAMPGIDALRVTEADVPDFRRIVVAVDPSGTKGDGGGDDIGIVVAALGVDGQGYVLDDATCQLSPEGWGRRAVDLYHRRRADRVVGEANFGGDMVRAIVQSADRTVSYRDVKASRGKVVRAEPIAALYEQGKVHHVGDFPDLEDQMCNFTANGYVGEGSPDRADALVWALTELMLDGKTSSLDAL